MSSPLISQSGASPSLQLGSSQYLSGTISTNPTFSSVQTLGMISGSVAAGLMWIVNAGDQEIQIAANTTFVQGNDFFVIPPATLTVTVQNGYSLLYAQKQKSGMSELTTVIDLLVTPNANSVEDVLTAGQTSIQGVYVPLAVLYSTNGEVSIDWEVDQHSTFSAPLLNEISGINTNVDNLETFANSQWNALSQDAQSVANWEIGWSKISLSATFQQVNLANQCVPANTDLYNGAGLPSGVSPTTIELNTIRFNPVHTTITVTLRGIQWGPNAVGASDFPNTLGDGWYQLYTQNTGTLDPNLNSLLPNASSLTGIYYYAPNTPLVVPALITTNGTPTNGTSIWQKDVIWYTDGNIYVHGGDTADNETNFGVPWGGGYPTDFSVYLMDASTNLPVLTQFPETPWSSPTFQSGYTGN